MKKINLKQRIDKVSKMMMLDALERLQAEQDGAGQPATRPESK
jgi:hypothetical protein